MGCHVCGKDHGTEYYFRICAPKNYEAKKQAMTDKPATNDELIARLQEPSYWKSSDGYTETFDRAPFDAAKALAAQDARIAELEKLVHFQGSALIAAEHNVEVLKVRLTGAT